MKPAKITTLVVVSLVALRLGCGWLFYREGSTKLDTGTFTSEPFLREAKGPFAGMYLAMVPDIYGAERRDMEHTRDQWENFQAKAADHFDFDKQQRDEAGLALDRAVARLGWLLDETAEEQEKHDNEARRLEAAREDKSTADVNFRSTWMAEKEKELDAELGQWLRQIDAIWDSYEREVNAVAAEGLLDVRGKEMSQLDYYGYLRLPRPGEGGLSARMADNVVPWFTLAVGVLLVLGLFTRLAALGGAAFLASVVASQPPLVPGAADTNYQIVLLLGLLVVAAVGAGRWGGLDYLFSWCCTACCRRSPPSRPPQGAEQPNKS